MSKLHASVYFRLGEYSWSAATAIQQYIPAMKTCLGEIHVHGFISYYSQRYTHWYITTVHYINFADLVVIHDCVEGLDPHGVNVPVQHDPLGVAISQVGEVSHNGGEQAWEEEHSVQPQHPPVQLLVQA